MALDLANILSKQRPFNIQFFQDGVVLLSVNGWGESTEEALEMLSQHVDELKAKLLLDTTDTKTRRNEPNLTARNREKRS